jgi:hypothetical protein
MRGEGWQRKSCQTLLASWAQMRHSLVLQAKTQQFFAGPDEVPPGFVEPDPEFFRLLGGLTVRCLVFFSENGAFDDNTEAAILDELSRARDQADMMSKFGETGGFEEIYSLNRARGRIPESFAFPDEPDYPEREDDTSDENWEKLQNAHEVPRAVDVFSGPEGHLQVAIGRPRILYVLYPWNGQELLCVGSVLPYYDFLHEPDRLTDSAWTKKLDSSPPPQPKWIAPIQELPTEEGKGEIKE